MGISFEKVNTQDEISKKNIPLSKREQELISEIEKLSFLSPLDKANILLTWRGLKKGTHIEFTIKRWGLQEQEPATSDETRKKLDDIKKVARAFGLVIVPGERMRHDSIPGQEKFIKEGWEAMNVYVAHSPGSARILKKAFEAKGNGDAVKELGEILGYPKTAVEAFYTKHERDTQPGEQKLMFFEEFPEEIQKEEYMAFLYFTLSRKHWKEELEVVKQWAEEIKQLSPLLYQEILKEHRDRRFGKDH